MSDTKKINQILKKRKADPTFDTDSLEIHSPFNSRQVREGDPVQAKLTKRSDQGHAKDITEMRVLAISPFGIQMQSLSPLEFKKGEEVDLEIQLGLNEVNFSGVVVHSIIDENIIGIRWFEDNKQQAVPINNRRKERRWNTSEEFLPTGVAINPLEYNDHIYFRVRDISASGLQIITSLRNKFLIPGIVIESTVNFPSVGSVGLPFKVINGKITKHNNKEFYQVGCEIQNMDFNSREIIGQYLSQFGSAESLRELVEGGFNVQSLSKSITFSYVRTSEDYDEVLKLRHLTYANSGRISHDDPVHVMSDEYDMRSRILVGRFHNRAVCSLRMVFPESNAKFEVEKNCDDPSKLPPASQTLEVTRVCNHPDFSGSDLLLEMMLHGLKVVMQTKRRYVLGCATSEQIGMYSRIGFRDTGAGFEHADFKNQRQRIIVMDLSRVVVGYDLNPIIWNIMAKNFYEYLIRTNIYEFGPGVKARMRFLRLFSPIAMILLKRKRMKGFKRKLKKLEAKKNQSATK